MLTSQDLKQIRQVVKEEVDSSAKTLRSEMNTMGQGLRSEIKSSENRIRNELGGKIEASEKTTRQEIGSFIGDIILPQLAEKADKTDIDRIERKIDKIIAKDMEQDAEIRNIKTQVRVLTHS